jgi:hypothetical protein
MTHEEKIAKWLIYDDGLDLCFAAYADGFDSLSVDDVKWFATDYASAYAGDPLDQDVDLNAVNWELVHEIILGEDNGR